MNHSGKYQAYSSHCRVGECRITDMQLTDWRWFWELCRYFCRVWPDNNDLGNSAGADYILDGRVISSFVKIIGLWQILVKTLDAQIASDF